MKTCPSCAALCEVDARFCLECGAELADALASGPTADPWEGRVVAGRFQIIEKLGDGGMGEVFLAEQTTMERQVALKVLRQELCSDPQQVERFKREAQAASRLSHPNTIIVHDFGLDEGGVLFIAMEYLEGLTVDQLLAARGALTPEETVRILVQVCGSLEEAHGLGVIHRDLKPENIFLTRRGHTEDFVKVLDFGIAKVQRDARGGQMSKLTRTGAIFGTPQYMSPEQIRGEDLDARSDIYALGVILYEMLSGHLPFQANSAVEMLTKHLSEKPPPIEQPDADPEIIAHLQAISMRALSKDPALRHGSVRAFMEDLMAALPSLSMTNMTGMVPVTAGATGHLVAPEPVSISASGAGNRGLLAALMVALLAAGGGAAWYLSQPSGGGGGGFDATPAAPAAFYQEGEGEVDTAKAEAEAKKAEEDAKKAEAEAAKATAEAEAEAKKAEEDAAKAKAEAEAAAQAADEKAKAEAEAKLKAAEEAKAKAEAEKKEAEEAAAAAKVEAEAAQEAVEAAKEAEKEEKDAVQDAPKDDAEAKALAAQAEAEAKAAEEAKAKAQAEAKAQAAAEKAQAEAAKRAEAEAKAQEAKLKAAAAQEAKAKAEADKLAAEEAKAKALAAKAQADADRQKAEAAVAAASAKAEEARKKAEAEAAAKAKAEEEAAAVKAKLEAAQAELDRIAAEKAKAEEEARIAEEKRKEALARRKAARAKKKYVKKRKVARVFVKTRSRKVRIYVDGKFRGTTPMRGISLKAGKHTVEGRLNGKKTKRKITVKGGKVQHVKLSM